jgi:hypothetical protein
MSTTAIILVLAIPAIAISILWILGMSLQWIVVALGIYWMLGGLYAASRLFW